MNIKRKLIILVMAVVILIVIAIPFNNYFKVKPVNSNDTITLEQALKYIETAQASHQNVLDHPAILKGQDPKIWGDLDFHAKMVKRYQQLKDFILTEEENKHEYD
jgi:hypothetical protein